MANNTHTKRGANMPCPDSVEKFIDDVVEAGAFAALIGSTKLEEFYSESLVALSVSMRHQDTGPLSVFREKWVM